MRVVLAATVFWIAACGRDAAKSEPATDVMQTRFDTARRPDKIIEAAALKPGFRVADIGAGPGQLTIHIARAVKPNGFVVATDVDGQVLERLQTRLAEAGLGDLIEARVALPDVPGLEPGLYDAIIIGEVDHLLCRQPPCSIEDVAHWLEGAARALKPTGRLVINNENHVRDSSIASARKAGFVLEYESTPTPTHFIAAFVKKPAPR